MTSCQNENLVLNKCDIGKWSEKDTVQTIGDLRIIKTIENGRMGDFATIYTICKENGPCYKLSYEKRLGIRFSKKYIAFTQDYGNTNWGWFNLENGRKIPDLPGIDVVLDSLKFRYSDKAYFFRVTNGFIDIFDDGRLIETINYGAYLPGLDKVNFDSLDYGVYKLEKTRLLNISENVDSIFTNHGTGLFFIPQPGYGITAKFDIKKILTAIDSVSKLKHSPDKLVFSNE